jgi:hypothetical protein
LGTLAGSMGTIEDQSFMVSVFDPRIFIVHFVMGLELDESGSPSWPYLRDGGSNAFAEKDINDKPGNLSYAAISVRNFRANENMKRF